MCACVRAFVFVCVCHTSGAWYTSFVDSVQRRTENGAVTGRQTA